MLSIIGKTICKGKAFGTALVYRKSKNIITRHHIESIETEIERFETARLIAISKLSELYNKTVDIIGVRNALIFNIHKDILNDINYIESIKDIIADEFINAETAVGYTCDNLVQNSDDIDKIRKLNIIDVSEILISILKNKDPEYFHSSEPVIIIAGSATPYDAIQFCKENVIGIALQDETISYYTDNILKALEIPVITNLNDIFNDKFNKKNIAIDADNSIVYIDPDSDIIANMSDK